MIHRKRGLQVRELNFYEFATGQSFFEEEYLTADNKNECISIFGFWLCSDSHGYDS